MSLANTLVLLQRICVTDPCYSRALIIIKLTVQKYSYTFRIRYLSLHTDKKNYFAYMKKCIPLSRLTLNCESNSNIQ